MEAPVKVAFIRGNIPNYSHSMTEDSQDRRVWEIGLRTFRSQLPPHADSGDRAKTFGAGLQQAEELWRAAERVDLVARPMLLFYGLTQAGRAICAAGPFNKWRPAQSHGLSFKLERPSSGKDLDFKCVRAEARGFGLIQQVAKILDSPTIDTSVALSDLLGALDIELLFDNEYVTAVGPLKVDQYSEILGNFGPPAFPGLIVGPVPERFTQASELVVASENNVEYMHLIPPSGEELEEWLSVYPKLKSLGMPTAEFGPEPDVSSLESGEYVIRLKWEGASQRDDVTQREWTTRRLDVVQSGNFGNAHGIVLPSIAGNSQPQKLLITWWLILYCLSMLARYYPKEWSEILDLDSSSVAVPLQELILAAQSKVPGHIFLSLVDLYDTPYI